MGIKIIGYTNNLIIKTNTYKQTYLLHFHPCSSSSSSLQITPFSNREIERQREAADQMEKLTVQIPETVLNSGHKMPLMGFGCGAFPLPPVEELTAILTEGIKAGYRHFDTAAQYGSEEALGKAVVEAIEGGLVKNGRDEFFITSKLSCKDADHDLVVPALKETLRKLGMNYLDLYLIHCPVRFKKNAKFFTLNPKEDILPFDIHGTWKAMEECKNLSLAKSIGVSNFTCEKLQKLLEKATIPPAVNQVEMNVGWQQRKLLPFCKEKGIHVSAWSPLGAYGTPWGTNIIVMENPVLKDIAACRNKTVAQVGLRWIYEQGVSVIVKSFNKERMSQNLEIFQFELTKEEVEQIEKIPQCRGNPINQLIHPEGVIKSLEELWDGDL